MKLIIAIINRDDSSHVIKHLSKAGFSSTKTASTGGFLQSGNVTIFVGVENEKVDEVIGIIEKYSHSRKQFVPSAAESYFGYCNTVPVEVTVGGATVFVLDAEQFVKL